MSVMSAVVETTISENEKDARGTPFRMLQIMHHAMINPTRSRVAEQCHVAYPTSLSQTAHRLRHSCISLRICLSCHRTFFVRHQSSSPASQRVFVCRELSQNQLLPDSPLTTRLPLEHSRSQAPPLSFFEVLHATCIELGPS